MRVLAVALTTDQVWLWRLDTDPDWGIAALGDEPLQTRTPGDLLALMAADVPAWLHRVGEGRDHPEHRREAASQLVLTLYALVGEQGERLNTNSDQIQTMIVDLTL